MNQKLIGKIAVDSGCVIVGDPVYYFEDKPNYESELKSAYPGGWSKLCDNELNESFDIVRSATLKFSIPQINREGLGVIVKTNRGDGVYPVYLSTDVNGRQQIVIPI